MRPDRGAIRMGLLLGLALASLVAAVIALLGYTTNQEVIGIFDRSARSSREIAVDNVSRFARLLASNTAVTVRPSVLDHNYSYIRAVLGDMTAQDDNLLYIAVVDTDSTVIEDSGNRELGARLRESGAEQTLDGEPVLRSTAPILSQETTVGSVILAYSTSQVAARIRDAQASNQRERSVTIRNLFVGGAGVLAVGLVIAAGFGMWLSRPVTRMAEAASRLGEGAFDVRVEIGGPREIRQLAATFNSMAGALEESLEASIEQAALEREIAIARRLQKEMMPPDETLVLGNVELLSWYAPAGKVGGDWWTITEPTADQCITVMVGDVIGHGIPAALFTAAAKSAYRAAGLLGAGGRPDHILATIDGVLRGFSGAHTMSACAVRIELTSGRLFVSSAGHPPPLRFHNAGKSVAMEILQSEGPLLGDDKPDGAFACSEYALEPNDVVVLFTDGLIEATNSGDRMFGLRRLVAAIEPHAAEPLEAILSSVKTALAAYVAEREVEDDVTLVLVRYTAPPASAAA